VTLFVRANTLSSNAPFRIWVKTKLLLYAGSICLGKSGKKEWGVSVAAFRSMAVKEQYFFPGKISSMLL
jgi:hypothetical protein